MTDDEGRGEIVVFGGLRAYETFLADTWTWDGNQWRQCAPSAGPTPRKGAGMAYHPGLGVVVLVGGSALRPADKGSDYREGDLGVEWRDLDAVVPGDVRAVFVVVLRHVARSAGGRLFALLGDDLHCASRGPKAFALTPGPGAILLSSYGAASPAVGMHGTITVSAAVPWTAISSASWIAITGASSAGGNTTITFDVAPNQAPDARQGDITVAGQVFRVRQAPAMAPGPPSFSDHPLEAGVTPVKAAHIAELRRCVRLADAIRLVGRRVDRSDAGSRRDGGQGRAHRRTAHALAQVYAAASLTGPTYARAALTAGATVITAADIEELRAAVLAIW
ncbi:MAG: BACON domain-containing protein [Desulfobacterales bacterium]|nr:BACON domain-containing protein [Desulfobacterales bacterium]